MRGARPHRSSASRTAAVLLLVAVLLAGAGAAWWVLVGVPRARAQAAAETADAFLAGWAAQDWPAVAARVRRPADEAVEAHRAMMADLAVEAATIEPTAVEVDDDRARVEFTAELELEGMGPLSYSGELALAYADQAWEVLWEPTVLHPAMVEGGRFQRSRTWPERGQILDSSGGLLAGEGESVVVGVEPQRLTDPQAATAALVAAGAAESEVRALLERDDLRPDWFYPVLELSRPDFDRLDPTLRPVPGIVFRESQSRAGPLAAPAIVGRTGPVTEELLAELGPPYEEGDVVGLSGIERALEQRLAGRPALEAAIVDADGEVVEILSRVAATPSEDVQLTIDPRVQRAAEQALADAPQPSALVAIDVATGGVRAAANNPANGFDRALAGRYPPGSSFKVVSSAALLEAGLGAQATMECPREQHVGGRAFRNAGMFELGTITHRTALARSCNTAYAGAVDLLDDGALAAAARAFGFDDGTGDLPLPSFGGSFPEPVDSTELAAASIGQGRVEASPLHMAAVAAAVARGEWRSPVLVVGDEQEQGPLPGDPAVLAEMMRAVVTEGTGTAANVPGPPVAGKTGSAEFGAEDPPRTHAWFIGFRGDLAFAVLVEDGGAGGAVAAPIAGRFLTLLN